MDALSHWDRSGVAASSRRRYQWWNRDQVRDPATEQDLAILEVSAALASSGRRVSARRQRRSKKAT